MCLKKGLQVPTTEACTMGLVLCELGTKLNDEHHVAVNLVSS